VSSALCGVLYYLKPLTPYGSGRTLLKDPPTWKQVREIAREDRVTLVITKKQVSIAYLDTSVIWLSLETMPGSRRCRPILMTGNG